MKIFIIILAVIVALLATMGSVFAQQKYAVIIAGNMHPDSAIIPVTEQWNHGNEKSPFYGYEVFWKETYLVWEMLVFGKKYDNDNVHVLFGDGRDFAFPGQSLRFMADSHGFIKATDANAKRKTIASTFTELASTITDSDSLFVWIMSHGGTDANGGYFYSYDNQKVYDSELASWLGNIAAHKKVIFLSFPKSGGFVPVIENNCSSVITAPEISPESTYPGKERQQESCVEELKSKIF